MERHDEREKRKFIRAGTIAAATYNVNRDSKHHPKPFTFVDVFPHLAESTEDNPEAEAAAVDLLFAGIAANFRRANPNLGAAAKVRKKVSKAEMING